MKPSRYYSCFLLRVFQNPSDRGGVRRKGSKEVSSEIAEGD